MTLGKGIGMLTGVDERTLQREYAYFVNVLIDVDLSEPVPSKASVKGGRKFLDAVEILKLPAFCSHCKCVGHEIRQCRGLKRVMQDNNHQGEAVNKDGQGKYRRRWQLQCTDKRHRMVVVLATDQRLEVKQLRLREKDNTIPKTPSRQNSLQQGEMELMG